jgi:ABC-2 type transport system permease protein
MSVAIGLEIPEPPRTLASRLRWALADGLTIARRNLSHIRRTPEKLVDVTIQPILFVLLFGYVFGSAVRVPGVAYRQFLMPGIFVLGMISPLASTAVGFAQDLSTGIVDRFRSLPMSRAGVLLGRSMSDLAETALSLAIVVPCGFLVGWRPEAGGLGVVSGFGLLVLIAFTMNLTGIYIGLVVRSPEIAQAAMFTIVFPLMFLSNAFVPTSGMSTFLRAIADWNPLSAFVAATRDLLGNGAVAAPTAWPMAHPLAASLLWCGLLIAIFLPLGIKRYRKGTAG